jgi:hypothetical protein
MADPRAATEYNGFLVVLLVIPLFFAYYVGGGWAYERWQRWRERRSAIS